MNIVSGIKHEPLTYDDLVQRFGSEMAFDFLLTVEKLAKVKDNDSTFDEEARLMKALEALNRAA